MEGNSSGGGGAGGGSAANSSSDFVCCLIAPLFLEASSNSYFVMRPLGPKALQVCANPRIAEKKYAEPNNFITIECWRTPHIGRLFGGAMLVIAL